MNDIRLSVLMTNYNHATFLPQRIPSILDQLGVQDELIFIDDGSTDNSRQIAEYYSKSDKRIKFIINPQNLGILPSIKRALAASRGIYVTWLASDDHILSNFIQKNMDVLLENPETGLSCSDCASQFVGFSDKNEKEIYSAPLLKGVTHPLILNPDEVRGFCWSSFFWVPGHTAIIKKEYLLKYGGFDSSLGHLCDWFLYHTIALNHGVAYIPGVFAVWREDKKSYSHAMGAKSRRYQMALFDRLNEDKKLRFLFQNSGLLHPLIKSNLCQMIFKPKYWIYLRGFLKRYLWYRLQKN